jgi:hypothetical protein
MNQAQQFVAFVKDQPQGSTAWVTQLRQQATQLIEFSSPSEVYVNNADSLDEEIDLPEGSQTTVKSDYTIFEFADMSMVVVVDTPSEVFVTLFGLINGEKAKIEYIKPTKE